MQTNEAYAESLVCVTVNTAIHAGDLLMMNWNTTTLYASEGFLEYVYFG